MTPAAPPIQENDRPPLSAYLIGILPPLFWSGNFLIARVMAGTIPPIQMSFWRWAAAFCIMAPFGLRQWNAHRATVRRELPFLIVLGAVGITAFNCFVYAALHFTTVVNAALINAILPAITFLFALLFLRETPTARQMVGVGVAMVGATAIVARGNIEALASLRFNIGDLLVLCGLTFWGLYTVLIRWRRTQLPMFLFLTITIGFGVLFHLPLIVWEYPRMGGMPVSWTTVAAIAYFAVFPSALAYIFWNRTVAALGPGRTGMFVYLMPVFSSILGVGILGEPFRFYHWIGITAIFAGIALTTFAAGAARKG